MPSRRPPADQSADAPEVEHAQELRSFGRRRGRKLSARQQHLLDAVLPRVALAPGQSPTGSLLDLFSVPVSRTWLEIGFGGGEHLAWQARANPDVGFIGCEVFEDGVVKALSAIEQRGLANVRLSTDDARELLRHLPDASLERVFVLFPDPWPKKRHVKRRLVNRGLFDQLARVMRPGGELRIGTDIADYLRTMLLAARGRADFAWQVQGAQDWRLRPADWPQTRYEAKAMREGRRCYFLRFIRTNGVPLPEALESAVTIP
jgi:tRNA (guanine-N7-)-methyltransferase